MVAQLQKQHKVLHVRGTLTSVMALKGEFCLCMCSLRLVSRHESGGAIVRPPESGVVVEKL